MLITAAKTMLISSFVVVVFNIEIEPVSLVEQNISVKDVISKQNTVTTSSKEASIIAEKKIAKIKAALNQKMHQTSLANQTEQ